MAQIVKCPNCTASLHFDAASGKVQCEYCGASFNVDELMSSATEADEKKLEDLASDKVRCRNITRSWLI